MQGTLSSWPGPEPHLQSNGGFRVWNNSKAGASTELGGVGEVGAENRVGAQCKTDVGGVDHQHLRPRIGKWSLPRAHTALGSIPGPAISQVRCHVLQPPPLGDGDVRNRRPAGRGRKEGRQKADAGWLLSGPSGCCDCVVFPGRILKRSVLP